MKRSPSRLLRIALRANAAFAVASAALLLAGAPAVASFLGNASPADAFGTGLLLAGFGATLLWIAGRPSVSARLVAAVIALDTAWVAGSLAVLWLPGSALSNPGRAAVSSIGAIVFVFGVLQTIGLIRSNPASPAPAAGR